MMIRSSLGAQAACLACPITVTNTLSRQANADGEGRQPPVITQDTHAHRGLMDLFLDTIQNPQHTNLLVSADKNLVQMRKPQCRKLIDLRHCAPPRIAEKSR